MQLVLLLVKFSFISSNELHIGGIFPIKGKGGWQGGQACMPAAELALEDVNKETNLLPGFKLILHSNDSEVCWLVRSYFRLSLFVVECEFVCFVGLISVGVLSLIFMTDRDMESNRLCKMVIKGFCLYFLILVCWGFFLPFTFSTEFRI